MPELPEVETTKKSLDPLLHAELRNVQVFQPKLRWQTPDNLMDLQGYTLATVRRRAKYLLLDFVNQVDNQTNDKKTLMVHLGMSGSLQQFGEGDNEVRKHDHVIFTFINQNNEPVHLHYHDPRRFGSILWTDDEYQYGDKLLGSLGVEPLDNSFNVEYLYECIHRVKLQASKATKTKKPITRAIKSVIMEQKVVVGVGNIYATESLFLAGIHPLTPAHKVPKEQLAILIEHIKDILATAIIKGGTTLKDFTANGKTGYFQQTLHVYGKKDEACGVCATILENVKINGRASIFCSTCQPLI